MERGVRCPTTERVVYPDDQMRCAERPTIVHCSVCHERHVCDPGEQMLLELRSSRVTDTDLDVSVIGSI